jgi:hypothetical protein
MRSMPVAAKGDVPGAGRFQGASKAIAEGPSGGYKGMQEFHEWVIIESICLHDS